MDSDDSEPLLGFVSEVLRDLQEELALLRARQSAALQRIAALPPRGDTTDFMECLIDIRNILTGKADSNG